MCMKYVNATVRAYYDVRMEDNKVSVMVKPFDRAEVPKDAAGRRISPAFKAVVHINILGTLDAANMENPVIAGKTLIFRLNMTQFNPDKSLRMTKVLSLFELDLSKAKCDTACYDFLNTTRIISVPSMTLPEGSGKFALKLFVTEKPEGVDLESLRYTNDYFSIQAMTQMEFV